MQLAAASRALGAALPGRSQSRLLMAGGGLGLGCCPVSWDLEPCRPGLSWREADPHSPPSASRDPFGSMSSLTRTRVPVCLSRMRKLRLRGRWPGESPQPVCSCTEMLPSQTQSSWGPASHRTGEDSEAWRREVTWRRPGCSWPSLLSLLAPGLGFPVLVFVFRCFHPAPASLPPNLSVGLTEEQVTAVTGRGQGFRG